MHFLDKNTNKRKVESLIQGHPDSQMLKWEQNLTVFYFWASVLFSLHYLLEQIN